MLYKQYTLFFGKNNKYVGLGVDFRGKIYIIICAKEYKNPYFERLRE